MEVNTKKIKLIKVFLGSTAFFVFTYLYAVYYRQIDVEPHTIISLYVCITAILMYRAHLYAESKSEALKRKIEKYYNQNKPSHWMNFRSKNKASFNRSFDFYVNAGKYKEGDDQKFIKMIGEYKDTKIDDNIAIEGKLTKVGLLFFFLLVVFNISFGVYIDRHK